MSEPDPRRRSPTGNPHFPPQQQASGPDPSRLRPSPSPNNYANSIPGYPGQPNSGDNGQAVSPPGFYAAPPGPAIIPGYPSGHSPPGPPGYPPTYPASIPASVPGQQPPGLAPGYSSVGSVENTMPAIPVYPAVPDGIAPMNPPAPPGTGPRAAHQPGTPKQVAPQKPQAESRGGERERGVTPQPDHPPVAEVSGTKGGGKHAGTENENNTLPAEITKAAARAAPPWLISMVVHLLLVVALALIQLSQSINPVLQIQATYADTLGEQYLDDTIVTTAMDTMEKVEPAFAKDAEPVDDPLAAMPKLEIMLNAPGSSIPFDAPSIGMALSGREKGAKEALLAAYGGNVQTEGAVGLALEWLRKNQQRDGTWSLVGPYSGGVTIENKTAATAMALLAFQGNGHTHQAGAHREPVAKGLQALLKMQDRDGNFFQQGVSGHRLYSQAMATIVVCELYAMTKDPEVKKAAELALDYAARIQADDGQGGGGWRYQPGQDVDTSVTGWFVMAYQSGRMAGLDNHSQTLQRVSEFLDHVEKVERDAGSITDLSYCYRIDEEPKLSMTAEALLCRQYLGWNRNEPRLLAGVRKILLPENLIRWDEPSFYYWYYATQVLHHMGGDEWHAWNKVMREVLPKAQESSGREKGSWSPSGDPYGYQGGRLYSTCFCVYMLEAYYRHLPVYPSQR